MFRALCDSKALSQSKGTLATRFMLFVLTELGPIRVLTRGEDSIEMTSGWWPRRPETAAQAFQRSPGSTHCKCDLTFTGGLDVTKTRTSAWERTYWGKNSRADKFKEDEGGSACLRPPSPSEFSVFSPLAPAFWAGGVTVTAAAAPTAVASSPLSPSSSSPEPESNVATVSGETRRGVSVRDSDAISSILLAGELGPGWTAQFHVEGTMAREGAVRARLIRSSSDRNSEQWLAGSGFSGMRV